MSNFIPTNNMLGIQPIASSNAVAPSQYQVGQSDSFGQTVALGFIVEAYDVASSKGAGEFIYLEGVASTVVGSLVIYDPLLATTTFAPNTAHLGQPLAVAMSANVASQYGWYQISGSAVISKTAVKFLPKTQVYMSATAGSIASTAASGKEILNAISSNSATVASGTGTVNVLINRPFMQGQVL